MVRRTHTAIPLCCDAASLLTEVALFGFSPEFYDVFPATVYRPSFIVLSVYKYRLAASKRLASKCL